MKRRSASSTGRMYAKTLRTSALAGLKSVIRPGAAADRHRTFAIDYAVF
ncbi:hypothetical protein [Nitrosomonas sp.]